jgi:alkanesulfonate monooxygenase SsuD/methylene tetrahydromethanopterin reductase-like flavin-dependent oxidoreductase (luciferase family)
MTLKTMLLLTENWDIFDPRDLSSLVNAAKTAEVAGIDGVMLSEHVVLGADSEAGGAKSNSREFDQPRNQPPTTPHPSSMVMLGAIASVTTRLTLFAGATLPVLRHPLQVAKDWSTLDLLCKGRLVVLPTVSWSEQEYAALGVDFHKRGKMLDEQYEIWHKVWREGPSSHTGEFYKFEDVYVEPKPWRTGGPCLWVTGAHLHAAALRRIVKYGSGYGPGGPMAPGEKDRIYEALRAAGRDPKSFDIMGGIMGFFKGSDDLADLDEACKQIPANLESGATTIIAKPSQYIRTVDEFPDFCRQFIDRVRAAS